MSEPENNDGLFMEQAAKLWQACGNIDDWKNGYVERLAKNVFSMSIQPADFPGFNEDTFEAVWNNYTRRLVMLTVAGRI